MTNIIKSINNNCNDNNDNNNNNDNNYNYWICKCGCGTKKIHNTKWAFISLYKKHKINNNKKIKEQEIQTDYTKKQSEITEIIDEIETIDENNSNILIPTIQYDTQLKKNIVIMKPLQIFDNLSNNNDNNDNIDNNEYCKITKSDKLIELRNLLHLDIL